MKELFLIAFLCLGSVTSTNLFDDVIFNKQGIGYKTNIPVIYDSIGRAPNGEYLKSLQRNFKTTTALSFTYKDNEYYISIEEKNCPSFLNNLKKGDLIFIDIVVFNTLNCYSMGRPNKTYCSYINKIQKKQQ